MPNPIVLTDDAKAVIELLNQIEASSKTFADLSETELQGFVSVFKSAVSDQAAVSSPAPQKGASPLQKHLDVADFPTQLPQSQRFKQHVFSKKGILRLELLTAIGKLKQSVKQGVSISSPVLEKLNALWMLLEDCNTVKTASNPEEKIDTAISSFRHSASAE